MDGSRHILVVDDDKELRGLLSRFLTGNGFRVSVAQDATAMTQAMSAARIDLIILDIMMPGEDGLSVCRRLRANGTIPIIMLTAKGAELERVVGLEMGADDYLSKPFSIHELLARVRAVLRRAAMPVPGSPAGARRVFEFAGWRLDVSRRELRSAASALVDLRAAEFDVLLALVEHPQRVLSRDQLLDLARGRAGDAFDRTIDQHQPAAPPSRSRSQGAGADRDNAQRGIHLHGGCHRQRSALVMRRPDSVTMTVGLAVVVAMLLAITLERVVVTALPYFGIERRQELPKVEERFLVQLPGRVAAQLDILDGTPVADRPAVLANAQLPQVRLRLLDAPAPNLGDRGEPDAEAMRRRIEAALSAPRPVIVADRYRLADEKAGPAGGRVENGAWIEASLSNGQWLLVVFNLDPPPPSDPVAAQFFLVSIGAWVITALALAALLSLVAARRVVKPLSELSGALDRLGPGGDEPSVPPHGPREIEGIIRAFNRMRERLRRFNEDRTRMMAAMSHDLRTPLTRLRMRIEMAQGLDDQQKMLEEVDMMTGMVESILSFTRDDAKQEARSLVDLSALVEGICEDAADAGEKVTFSGPRGVTISCRPTAMRRAISNLVDNAVKYGRTSAVTLASEGDRVVILVEDEGPGILRSEREKVFEPFYRIGSARDPSTGGVGLGLSVTRSIVWEHGGEISLGSRKGGGLAVRVQLPAEPGTETGGQAPTPGTSEI